MMPMPYPTCLWLLPGVIVLEILYVLSALRVPIGRALLAMTSVNMATTGLGFPLAWLVYLGVRQIPDFPGGPAVFPDMRIVPQWMSMRLFPEWMGTAQEIWVILAIFLILLVPSYLLSRWLKTWVITWYDLLACGGDTKTVILGANRASYALLAVIGCAMLLKAYHGT